MANVTESRGTSSATVESTPLPVLTDRERLLDEAKTLQEEIQRGMPTATEMRASQPYMVTRHRRWEERNRTNILRYQEIRSEFSDLPSVEELRVP